MQEPAKLRSFVPATLDDLSTSELLSLAAGYHLIDKVHIDAGTLHLSLGKLVLCFSEEEGTSFVRALLRGYGRLISSGKRVAWQAV